MCNVPLRQLRVLRPLDLELAATGLCGRTTAAHEVCRKGCASPADPIHVRYGDPHELHRASLNEYRARGFFEPPHCASTENAGARGREVHRGLGSGNSPDRRQNNREDRNSESAEPVASAWLCVVGPGRGGGCPSPPSFHALSCSSCG